LSANTFLLVALSALTHAYWNFLLKRTGGSQTVVALSKLVEAALFLPLLAFGLTPGTEQVFNLWMLPVVGAGLVLLNYVLLAAAYSRGDLSVIYPVVRGGMLGFLPPLAYITIGERLTPLGWAAIGAILVGIYFLQFWNRSTLRALFSPAIVFALAAGLVAAGYTIWDKRAVQIMSPATYFGAYTVILGVAYGLLLIPSFHSRAAHAIWSREWANIVQIGLFNSGSYLLTLAALRDDGASHVLAVRQLSIAIGALMGWRWLGESLPGHRVVGVVLIACGCILMGISR
jgi:drug/metabolite transporter (DMT)-like permease